MKTPRLTKPNRVVIDITTSPFYQMLIFISAFKIGFGSDGDLHVLFQQYTCVKQRPCLLNSVLSNGDVKFALI